MTSQNEEYPSPLTTVHLIWVVFAVRSTITTHRDRDTLLAVQTCKLAWLTARRRHLATTRGRCSHTAGGHQLIYKSKRQSWFMSLVMWRHPQSSVRTKEHTQINIWTLMMYFTCVFQCWYLFYSQEFPHAGKRYVWTLQEGCERSGLGPADSASGSQVSCQPSALQTPATEGTLGWGRMMPCSFSLFCYSGMCF